jgi:hypothetical protein
MIAACLLLGAAPAEAETLREALADAWATNPTLGAARRQQALEQTPDVALAAGRLTASADATAAMTMSPMARAGLARHGQPAGVDRADVSPRRCAWRKAMWPRARKGCAQRGGGA